MKLAICFLVVNEVKELPTLSIRSVLDLTEAPIFVGYFRERDVSDLPKHDQITFIKIADLPEEETLGYQNFGTNSFYDLVSRKWDLISKVLNLGFDFVIYNDIDLVWARDAGTEVTNTFASNQNTQILVQSLTESPAHPSLCMGFIALRNSAFTVDFLNECAEANLKSRNRMEMIGDDEIITEIYKNRNFDSRIRELPQVTFPVGYFISLFRGVSPMPGMVSASPYVFHANYVIGERNKRILLRLFLGRKRLRKLGIKRSYFLVMVYTLKRIKTLYYRVTR
jgi:hypothetical protein